MDGHRESWQAHMFRGRFQLIYSKYHCWFLQIFSLSGEQAWSGFDQYLAYAAKSRHDDSWQGRTFWHQYVLLAERKRIFLFPKCCIV